MRARDLRQKYELVNVGHRFGKVSVLATMLGKFYSKKIERTSNADRMKFNGRLVQINMNLIGPSIVAFVRSLVGNFRETRKLQYVQNHKTNFQKANETNVDLDQRTLELQSIGIRCPLELLGINLTWRCSQDTHLSKTVPHDY